MKTILMTVAGMTAMVAGASAPVVKTSSVTMTQNRSSRLVTINYTLEEEPAIVTVDIQTNGVSIGGRNLWYFAGDVNKCVDVGPHTMTWRPDKAWPGHKLTDGVTAVVTAWATNTPPDVMAVSLVTKKTRLYYPSLEAVPGGVNADLYKTGMMAFRKCPAANVTWRMGAPKSEYSFWNDPAHLVTLSNDFYIGVFQVTQRQYELIAGSVPEGGYDGEDRATHPVEQVSYNTLRKSSWPSSGSAVDSNSFIGKMRGFTGLTSLDLPLDAQWEFACRAGCGATYYDGSNPTDKAAANVEMNRMGRYKENGTTTAVVGSFEPNAWGIYDMSGNIWEWCLDWFVENPVNCDPNVGPDSGSGRVVRGGAYSQAAAACKSAYRYSREVTFGLGCRLVCSVEMPN